LCDHHDRVSLKSNIAAGYASQLWTALIGIVLMPLYLKYMGSEAYGLVGFFVMLQGIFVVLDLGLTPTIARESARYFGGALKALAFRQLFRSLMLLFLCVALAGSGVLFVLAPYISERWLKIRDLPLAEVRGAVQIMAFSVALRWMGGLFRGVISGSERLVWLSGFNAAIAALRFVGALASMWLWGYTPRVFFWHQFAVATLADTESGEHRRTDRLVVQTNTPAAPFLPDDRLHIVSLDLADAV
jgi:O-antigen/teichoic acid export membrane protein